MAQHTMRLSAQLRVRSRNERVLTPPGVGIVVGVGLPDSSVAPDLSAIEQFTLSKIVVPMSTSVVLL